MPGPLPRRVLAVQIHEDRNSVPCKAFSETLMFHRACEKAWVHCRFLLRGWSRSNILVKRISA
jgi:hypothetical protein